MNEPSWRKPAGIFFLLGWIVAWLGVAASLPRPDSPLVQIVWFGVLGLVWIAPLKSVLRWMETGRFL